MFRSHLWLPSNGESALNIAQSSWCLAGMEVMKLRSPWISQGSARLFQNFDVIRDMETPPQMGFRWFYIIWRVNAGSYVVIRHLSRPLLVPIAWVPGQNGIFMCLSTHFRVNSAMCRSGGRESTYAMCIYCTSSKFVNRSSSRINTGFLQLSQPWEDSAQIWRYLWTVSQDSWVYAECLSVQAFLIFPTSPFSLTYRRSFWNHVHAPIWRGWSRQLSTSTWSQPNGSGR